VGAQEKSGLSVKEFCLAENLCRTSFYAIRKRLGMSKGSMATLPALKEGKTERVTKGFLRLTPPTAKEAICIETPNGYKVNAGYFGEDGLKSLLQVLRAL
jgi:hypothetical protein